MQEFLLVGRVAKAHGVKGEICIDYHADALALIKKSIFLQGHDAHGRPTPLQEFSVTGLRLHQGRPLLFLKGVPDRNAAELLRGLEVYVPQNRLPKLKPGEFYLKDLPGFEVMARGEDGSETLLGKIAAVDLSSGQEVWSIHTPEGKEVLFPAVPDFVLNLDQEQKRAVIAPPPGLLDIYLI